MSNQKQAGSHRVALPLATAALAVLAFATPTLVPAQTNGMERRDDRGDNREDRRDTRDDCREAEGAGKDKRDCKQDERGSNDEDDSTDD